MRRNGIKKLTSTARRTARRKIRFPAYSIIGDDEEGQRCGATITVGSSGSSRSGTDPRHIPSTFPLGNRYGGKRRPPYRRPTGDRSPGPSRSCPCCRAYGLPLSERAPPSKRADKTADRSLQASGCEARRHHHHHRGRSASLDRPSPRSEPSSILKNRAGEVRCPSNSSRRHRQRRPGSGTRRLYDCRVGMCNHVTDRGMVTARGSVRSGRTGPSSPTVKVPKE